ncbi:ABC transporter permease [bacterium]|jgi:phospholipid/cholesterol/gamma-HCH transport system permease protein|nr:ABC transporter permease [bacterium]
MARTITFFFLTNSLPCNSQGSGLNCFLVNIIELVRSIITLLGDFTLFVVEILKSSRFFWKRKDLLLRHSEFIGVNSLLITAMAAIFMGAVLGYQLYVSLHRFGSEALLGGTVGVALFRELSPVMTGIMVTGRAGAAMAAEISSMRVTEQVDALEIMAVDPVEYLVFPRVLSGLLMVPILALFFTIVATIAACVVACGVMDLQYSTYWSQYLKIVDLIELLHCTVKSAVFGLVLTCIGCFCGFRAYGGARAVGQATRNTVVASFLTILLFDYLLTAVLPFGFKTLKVM